MKNKLQVTLEDQFKKRFSVLKTVTTVQTDYRSMTDEDENKINAFLEDMFRKQEEKDQS